MLRSKLGIVFRAVLLIAFAMCGIEMRPRVAAKEKPRVRKILNGDQIKFQSGVTHHVYRQALAQMPSLTIRDLKDATIHFHGEIQGNVTTKRSWQNDRGVVNIINCENVEITGLNVTNLRRYEPVKEIGRQESTALCVSGSKSIRISDSKFSGLGKSIVLLHSGSEVIFRSVEINGYYFELQVGASRAKLDGVVFNQFHPLGNDNHSVICVGSSMRSEETAQLHKNTSISLRESRFQYANRARNRLRQRKLRYSIGSNIRRSSGYQPRFFRCWFRHPARELPQHYDQTQAANSRLGGHRIK